MPVWLDETRKHGRGLGAANSEQVTVEVLPLLPLVERHCGLRRELERREALGPAPLHRTD